MKYIKGGIFGLAILLSLSFINQDLLEWSENTKLSYSDFKGTVPANAKNQKRLNITTVISYEIRQESGKIPQIIIYNFVDRKASWANVKSQNALDIQQIKFDYSELYARKIRKKMGEMNKAKIIEKQKYVNQISKIAGQSKKSQSRSSMLLEDQPHLIKIMKQEVNDSLNLYKDFKK